MSLTAADRQAYAIDAGKIGQLVENAEPITTYTGLWSCVGAGNRTRTDGLGEHWN